MSGQAHASHFESGARQADATLLGMWLFLASELLLFGGLFALYAAGRFENPSAFRQGVALAAKTVGSLNTGILLVSSSTVAVSVEFLRRDQRHASVICLLTTVLLGAAFLALKFSEYAEHFKAGIRPGGAGPFFATHATPGLALFWTLYFFSTGLHAVHVSIGLLLLGSTAWRVSQGAITSARLYSLQNVALYWHLIDLIWVFLWPLYYLA